MRSTAKPGHRCFKKSTICAWWLVTRCVPCDARTRERKRASEFPRQQRSICCDSKTRALRRRASRPLSTGLRSQVPDSSSQRENLISLFGPNLFHSLDTMVRTKIHEQARQGIERLIKERALTPGCKLPSESNLAGLLLRQSDYDPQRLESPGTRRQNRTHTRARENCRQSHAVE